MFQTVFGQMVATHDVEIATLQYDSRQIGRGDVFVAIKGATTDGHKYINAAVTKGAKVVVVEDDAAMPDSFFMHTGVVKIVVPDARKALARMAANYFDHPSRKLTLIGVTGTKRTDGESD
jgi:UDP-N-acetylmuramoyl-L-alanyl-D-glutamate--2,6-diaminopimelate ligase